MTGAVHFEAKLHALRRTQDGTVASFLIHPSEVPTCIALDPLGQRYMVALAGINDDETAREALSNKPNAPNKVPEVPNKAPEVPSSPGFAATARAKAAYAAGTEGERARARAAMLCNDARFMGWVRIYDAERVANFIRKRCCRGESRSLIATDPECLKRFLAMETQYLADTNQMAEAR